MKKLIIIVVGIALIAMLFWLINSERIEVNPLSPFTQIDTKDYISVEKMTWTYCKSSNDDHIKLFVDLINSVGGYETIKWQQTNKSPDIVICFERANGKNDSFQFYGPYIRIIDREKGIDKQYRMSDWEKFYSESERIAKEVGFSKE